MGKTHDAVLMVRLPAELLARVRAVWGDQVPRRVRLGLERDLRERERKRGYSPLRDPVTGSVAGLADALGGKLGSDPIDPAADDLPS